MSTDFESLLKETGFADEVRKFIKQAKTGELKTKDLYSDKIFSYKLKVSFGQGNIAQIPWIAFLGEGQEVSDGIYPVFLYYKTSDHLVLSYGISETKSPKKNWSDSILKNKTVFQHMREKGFPLKRYGTSYVAAVYDNASQIVNEPSFDTTLYHDLGRVLQNYQHTLESEGSANDSPEATIPEDTPMLNQILFGPPGTGKTYATVSTALSILDKDYYELNQSNRSALKIRFEQLREDGFISFVTFHQSFTYEDFVEGLRPSIGASKQLEYHVEPGIFKRICNDAAASPSKPYVLIIDEINRGNVSRIFGELITLIETSKRKGEDEEIVTKLPYSKEIFSVPNNVYIIGTMNTADRSLSGLDIALRRRFIFRETPPKPELLEDINIEGVNVGNMLSVMNNRIQVLLNADHCLGHAYFIPLKKNPTLEHLSSIFKDQIIPLLQEYFFEDWQKIRWILNDHRKHSDFCFISPAQWDQSLFGTEVNEPLKGNIYKINDTHFSKIEAYLGIIDIKLITPLETIAEGTSA